ncbi:hypothetical protein PM10SUCC1_02540 [Propionigenium maris DSM 9537]|uniref:Phage DNA packaging protein, Nu1 subunit of terminase n=1 Tax=Propionigenium maris DSM 9537 TaxID=1123000 RepID=A0A9W6LLI1_9FUSO|nr:hypothetical protein [Propionigenium maris]GLI54739.1 hypothetical protein PM10SUCC1_02540 [Propionigenium maris DSM 9537]
MKIKLVRKKTLLEAFQVTEKQLANLERDGIVVKYGEGYKLIESLKNYCDMKQRRHGGSQEGNVSLVELSEILGIAERTVRELTMKGALKREDVGVYNLKESIQGYLTYKLGNSEESKKEILLRKKADRELREMALLEKKGELVKKSDVKEFLGGMLISFKESLLAFPDKLASQNELDPKTRDEITGSMDELLEELEAYEYR